MVKVLIRIQMVIITREISKTTCRKDKEYSNGLMAKNMREVGKQISNMDKDY